jgi:hypothetical protein
MELTAVTKTVQSIFSEQRKYIVPRFQREYSWKADELSQIKNQDIKSLFNKDDKSEQEYLMKTIRELDKHYSLYVDGDKKISKIKDKAFWELIE